MEEIIYLEQDEEITSVIDKLKKLEGKSVALVIPKGAGLLQSIVNLKILKKEAESLDKEIALVTQDRIGRNLASQVGLSVYDKAAADRPILQPARPEPDTTETIEVDLSRDRKIKPPPGVKVHRYDESAAKAQLAKFSQPPTHITAKPLSAEDYKIPPVGKPETLGKRKLVISLIMAIVVIGLLVGFYLFYPKAIITLVLNTEPYEKKIEILVDNNINKIDEQRLVIPGELQEVEEETSQEFSSTGRKEVGEKAKGKVKISNGTGDEQNIAAGTEFVSSAELSFVAIAAITVPKATASVDSAGNVVKKSGVAEVGIEAKEPGTKYNISAGSLTIPANSKVSAEATAALSGGTSQQIKIVSQDDINKAKVEIIEKLKAANREKIHKKISKAKIMDTAVIDETIAFSTDKETNAQADSFKATIKLKSRTLSFDEEEYRTIIAQALTKDLAADKELVLTPADEIATNFESADFSIGIMKISGTVKTKLVLKIDHQELIGKIADQSKESAQEILKNTPGVESVDIYLRPSWWLKKIPKLQRNIEIKKES